MSAIHRDFESLHPKFQVIAETWLHICKDDLSVEMRVLETLRDRERQKDLESRGKSKVKVGWHNVGLALDFACFDERGVYDTDNHSGLYTKCGLVAEAMGCVWGGRWRMRDYGHIEWHEGFTLQQFLNGSKEGVI